MKTKLSELHSRRLVLREAFRNYWLKATCDQMFHTLPRELRDMIYVQLMDGAYISVSEEEDPSTDPGGVDWVLDHHDKGRDYHCFKEELVGREVFRELIQTFYRKAHIEDYLLTEGDLEDFLSRDKWGLDIRPLDHLLAVALDVYEEDFTDPALQDNLDSLARLKPGARLYIDLWCAPNDYVNERTMGCGVGGCKEVDFYSRDVADVLSFFKGLNLLMPIFQRIIDAGIRLRLCFKNWEDTPIVVKLYKHGAGMALDIRTWVQLVLERKYVGASDECV